MVLIIGIVGAGGSGSKDNEPSTSTKPGVTEQAPEPTTEKPAETTESITQKISEQEFKDSCEVFDYKKIARNPDDYIGKNFKIDVQIFQTVNGGFFSGYDKYYKANLKSDDFDYYLGEMIYLFDEQDKDSASFLKILDNDIVMVYGTFEGMVTSENALTKTKDEKVALHIYYAELISE